MFRSTKLCAFVSNLLLVVCVSLLPTCATSKETPEPTNGPLISLLPIETHAKTQLASRVFIDDKFSYIERVSVEKGIEEWQRASNGVLKLFIQKHGSWNSNWPLIDVPKPDPITHIIHCTKDIYVSRVFSQDTIVISIENTLSKGGIDITLAGYAVPSCEMKYFFIVGDDVGSNEEFVDVTMHEFGHIIGMQHVEAPFKTVMYPSLDKSAKCLTEIDMKQFAKIWRVDYKLMRPCTN